MYRILPSLSLHIFRLRVSQLTYSYIYLHTHLIYRILIFVLRYIIIKVFTYSDWGILIFVLSSRRRSASRHAPSFHRACKWNNWRAYQSCSMSSSLKLTQKYRKLTKSKCPTNSDVSFFLVNYWIFSLCGEKPLHWVLGWVDFTGKEYTIFDGLPKLYLSTWAFSE